MNFKDLTVVGVLNPEKPKNGKQLIEIHPKKKYLESFKSKKIFFAETKLSYKDFSTFFENDDVGGDKLGVYMKMINSDSLFKKQLFSGNPYFEIKEIRYDENYKRILNLENMITRRFAQDRANQLRAEILYARTFEQAEFLLHEGSLENPKDKVLYVNYVTGYAIHLLTGCKFFEDVNVEDFDTEKLKNDLSFIYRAYKLYCVWEFDQKPQITGKYSNRKHFKLFYFFTDEKLKRIEGFISDKVGLQYFTGVLENDSKITLNSQYFTNQSELPSRWHLVSCSEQKDMCFFLDTKTGFCKTQSGKEKNLSFKINS